MDKYTKQFKKVLKEVFERSHPQKKETAQKAGISRSQLDKYLDPGDETSPQLETLFRISDALGVSFEEFIKDDLDPIEMIEAGLRALRARPNITGPNTAQAPKSVSEKIQSIPSNKIAEFEALIDSFLEANSLAVVKAPEREHE
jgi:transcriptional regulator with XRE-family HTH domain